MLKTHESNTAFVFIEAEKLSMDDAFMKYKPTTLRAKSTKKLITIAIAKKVPNFYCAKYAPSFSSDGNGIAFEPGNMPAIGKSYDWWVEAAHNYDPVHNSCIGIRIQYGAFLAVFIKELVKAGVPVEEAWDVVCNDSSELGHYKTSENASDFFEPTGSREICGFCDLGNTYKLLAEEYTGNVEGFWMAGGKFSDNGTDYPLSDIDYDIFPDEPCYNSVGWIVFNCA